MQATDPRVERLHIKANWEIDQIIASYKDTMKNKPEAHPSNDCMEIASHFLTEVINLNDDTPKMANELAHYCWLMAGMIQRLGRA